MVINGLQAYVLQKQEESDVRYRLTLFARERGRFTLWVKRKARVLYEPFTPLWLLLETRHTREFIKTVEIEQTGMRLTGDALWCGWYINELLMYLLSPNEAHAEIYDLYVETLNALAHANDNASLQMILRRFEWTLLQALGLGITLLDEANGKGPVVKNCFYQCVPGLGLVESPQGISGGAILAFAEGEWADQAVLHMAKRLTRLLIDAALEGRPLKTRTLFRSMHAVSE